MSWANTLLLVFMEAVSKARSGQLPESLFAVYIDTVFHC
jgi:hypothetical protein